MTRRLFASHPRASCMASARTFLDTSTLSSTLNQRYVFSHCARRRTRRVCLSPLVIIGSHIVIPGKLPVMAVLPSLQRPSPLVSSSHPALISIAITDLLSGNSVLLLKAFFPTHCTRWHTRNSNALVRWVAPFHPDHPTRVFLFLWVSISDRRSTFYHILACLLVVSRWQSRHFAGQGGVQRTINPQPARFLSARHGTVMWRPVRSTDSQHPQLLMEISSKW